MNQKYREWDKDSVFPSFDDPFFPEHLSRYRFAQNFCTGKSVLELACGKGYGSLVLAEKALSVTAVDLNEESLEFAKAVYQRHNINFIKHDVTQLKDLT